MASITGVLQSNDGDDLYPYTFDGQVLDNNNTPISQRLGSASEAQAVSGSTAFAKINTLHSQLTSVDTVATNKVQAQVTPSASIYQKFSFSDQTGYRGLEIWIGKLDANTNYVQFFVNGLDRGYIKFDVSRNIGEPYAPTT